jgi:hypothetical protein
VPGYREVRDAAAVKSLLAKVSVPLFQPRSDVKIQTDEKATEEDRQSEAEWVDQVGRAFVSTLIIRPAVWLLLCD